MGPYDGDSTTIDNNHRRQGIVEGEEVVKLMIPQILEEKIYIIP